MGVDPNYIDKDGRFAAPKTLDERLPVRGLAIAAPSPQDMNLAPEQSELMTNVIIDGQINSENLKSTGNDLNWLQNQISSQGYTSEKDILLGIFDITNNLVTFYPKDTEELTFDPFE